MYQPVTVVTPQGQVVTQALSPGTIRVQNNQVCVCVCESVRQTERDSHPHLTVEIPEPIQQM